MHGNLEIFKAKETAKTYRSFAKKGDIYPAIISIYFIEGEEVQCSIGRASSQARNLSVSYTIM